MTRAKDPLAVETEARLQKAVASILRKEHTCHSAAIAFNVPCSALYDRINGGKKPRNLAHESEQFLFHAEEKELVRWITRLTIGGSPPRRSILWEMAEEVRKRRVKKSTTTRYN
jgi:hypothetical protein